MMEQSIKVASVVALYWFVSISMVFLNKHLLSNATLDAPMFVTWFQCVVAVAACYILGSLRETHPLFNMFPTYRYEPRLARVVLPLSLVFVGMIAFNNLCLKYVGVAFYNVGRSMTTFFNVALSYIFLGQRTGVKAMAMCAVIIGGFFLGVDEESDSPEGVSYMGVFFGVCASVCVALNAVFIKKILPELDGDMWRLTAYNNTNALLLFLPVMLLFGEVPVIVASEDIYSGTYWFFMVGAGLFGIAIGLVSMLQIRTTSPLTHNISGTAKACAQTILALHLSGDTKSAIWWLSNVMVLGGASGYTLVKRAEMKAEQEARAAQEARKPEQRA